jgi:hypothetical protein
MVVLSLPERIWTPDIVWGKDDSSSEPDSPTPTQSPKSTRPAFISMHSSFTTTGTGASSTLPPPPPISASEVADPPVTSESSTSTSTKPVKVRRKSQKYYSKDECAICMDSFHRGEVVRILPCGHVFHKDECDEWLMKWRKLVSLQPISMGQGLMNSVQHAELMLRFLPAPLYRGRRSRQSTTSMSMKVITMKKKKNIGLRRLSETSRNQYEDYLPDLDLPSGTKKRMKTRLWYLLLVRLDDLIGLSRVCFYELFMLRYEASSPLFCQDRISLVVYMYAMMTASLNELWAIDHIPVGDEVFVQTVQLLVREFW